MRSSMYIDTHRHTWDGQRVDVYPKSIPISLACGMGKRESSLGDILRGICCEHAVAERER